jgi:hypothetical protein
MQPSWRVVHLKRLNESSVKIGTCFNQHILRAQVQIYQNDFHSIYSKISSNPITVILSLLPSIAHDFSHYPFLSCKLSPSSPLLLYKPPKPPTPQDPKNFPGSTMATEFPPEVAAGFAVEEAEVLAGLAPEEVILAATCCSQLWTKRR